MNPLDETQPSQQPRPDSETPSTPQETAATSVDSLEQPSSVLLPQVTPVRVYPPDLQISWSWPHLIVFLLFLFISLVRVQGALLAIYAPHEKLSTQQLEEYMLSKPQVAIGSTILIYGLVLLFLYVTLALLRGQPFWSTLGWGPIAPKKDGRRRHPMVYFFTGVGLSLVVVAISSQLTTPENAPIEQVFKYKLTAILFVATAMLIAPVAEETVFRGYLYPMFARWVGVVPSILFTGFLFGLMHGPQLGGAKSLIVVMSCVGMVFTWIRARTGSVFASYLMHFGYNSFIGVSLILSTHGFTQIPAH
jgi:membrane protease YdiL (CAAX protease family)